MGCGNQSPLYQVDLCERKNLMEMLVKCVLRPKKTVSSLPLPLDHLLWLSPAATTTIKNSMERILGKASCQEPARK